MKWKNNLIVWLSHRFIKSVWKKGVFPCYIGKDGNCWNWPVVSWTASLCSAWKCLQLSRQVPCSIRSSGRESAKTWVVGKLEPFLTKNAYSSPVVGCFSAWVGERVWGLEWSPQDFRVVWFVLSSHERGGSGSQFSAHLFKRESIWRLCHWHCLHATTSEARVEVFSQHFAIFTWLTQKS